MKDHIQRVTGRTTAVDPKPVLKPFARPWKNQEHSFSVPALFHQSVKGRRMCSWDRCYPCVALIFSETLCPEIRTVKTSTGKCNENLWKLVWVSRTFKSLMCISVYIECPFYRHALTETASTVSLKPKRLKNKYDLVYISLCFVQMMR